MNLRRALLSVAALSFLSVLAVPAQAGSDNPYWNVETNIPVETIEGDWTVAESGRTANLEFDGVNVIGQTTKFTAGWTSPWVHAAPTNGGHLTYLVDPLTEGTLVTMTRVQTRGHHWGPWFRIKLPFTDGAGGWYWEGGSLGFGRGPIRYEWRMIGTITGNGYIEGAAEISVE